ncbi:MAG: PIN domain-containing protein [Beijerinckiaceae bacterium]
MIGIDTNVLLRYVLSDDPVQSEIARRFVDEDCSPQAQAFINLISLVEMWWVLHRTQKVPKARLVSLMGDLLENPHIAFADIEIVASALEAYSEGRADFPDYLIFFDNRRLGAHSTVSFAIDATRTDYMTHLRE